MTFIDLFAGVGGFRRGFELAGHKCVGFCEWDKYATASYTSMHLITEEQREYLSTLDLKQRQKEILKEEYRNGEWYSNDIRNVRGNEIPRADCYCFGAPCTDFSVAGNRAGLDGDNSSLVREVFRILREIREEDRPEWIIYENVKGMFSSNRGFDFLAILSEMDELGYDIEWQLFNSKYYVPQNRERVYTIGHLRSRGSRKIFPIEGTGGKDSAPVNLIGHRANYRKNYQVFMPDGITEALDTATGGGRGYHTALKLFGIDYCAGGKERDIANAIIRKYDQGVSNRGATGTAVCVPIIYDDYNSKLRSDGNACTLTQNCGASASRNGQKVCIPVLTPDRAEKRQNGRRFKDDGEEAFTLTAQDKHGVAFSIDDFYSGRDNRIYEEMAPTLRSDRHGLKVGHDVAVKVKEATKIGYAEAHEGDSINFTMPESKTRRGRVGKGVAQTLDTSCNQGVFVTLNDECTVYATWYEKYNCYIAIRKLTPRECFRLQGWDDDYFDRAEFVNSNSQLYKQAGNGVTVDVVYDIARRM